MVLPLDHQGGNTCSQQNRYGNHAYRPVAQNVLPLRSCYGADRLHKVWLRSQRSCMEGKCVITFRQVNDDGVFLALG